MLPTLPEVFIPLAERPHLEAAVEKASRQGHPVANFLKGELERASFCSRADMPPKMLQPHLLRFWLLLGIFGSVVLAAVVTALPLRSGLKHFRRLEV